jgi:putative Mn2+ efflux pump MntP
MPIIEILLIGCVLSLDAMAVAVTNAICSKKESVGSGLKIALSFGFFQAIMPLAGYFAGVGFKSLIENIDHWIAFSLLLLVGAKMIYEGFKKEEKSCEKDSLAENSNFKLLVLSIATSIDALAVGISFAFLKVEIFSAVSIIGITTFVLTFAADYFGKKCSKFFSQKINIVGGLVLIFIGVDILLEHLYGITLI